MSLLQLAFTFFLIANPIGNAPSFVALLKDFPVERQRRILLREALFALLLCLFFEFFGDVLLNLIAVRNFTLTISGGIVLLLSALAMIFSVRTAPGTRQEPQKREPFVVPIATPLLAGGGLLTLVMLYSHQLPKTTVTLALLIAWVGVIAATICAPFLQNIFGRRGLAALEHFVGMLLLMMACNLIDRGLGAFIESLK